jgi:hypothetical protein
MHWELGSKITTRCRSLKLGVSAEQLFRENFTRMRKMNDKNEECQGDRDNKLLLTTTEKDYVNAMH